MSKTVFSIRLIAVLVFFIFICKTAPSQTDSLKTRTRNGIWFSPSAAQQVNGILIGPIEQFGDSQTVNGVAVFFIGTGVIMGLPLHVAGSVDSTEQWRYPTYNGLVISGSGSYTPRVNGCSISAFIGAAHKVNGVIVNPVTYVDTLHGLSLGIMSNQSRAVNGIQIGLYNRTEQLKGIQIGLWNRNQKRALPFVNWG